MMIFTQLRCCECDVVFGMTETLYARRRADKHMFYCPNGHQQHFSESESDRLRRKLDRLVQEQSRLEDEKQDALKRAAKAETALTRHKKRSAAGVCPCCTRTFTNMARHIKSKHPEFSDNVVALKKPA